MYEVADRVAGIVEHAGVPVIAEADTDYGNALNVQRTVCEFERAGVAALHLEDQVFPKRCGHYDDKAVVLEQSKPAFLRLKDSLTNSVVRLQTNDRLLTETFWNHYHKGSRRRD